MCLCHGGDFEENNNVNVGVPWRVSDAQYVDLIKKNFAPRAAAFRPEIIFWNWGYDGMQGEYGDMGLSIDAHTMMARELKRVADEVCRGRLIVVLCGGSRRDMAQSLIPPLIRMLAGE
jgi:acetoin utilization deacetylase AcuC-like enzyme